MIGTSASIAIRAAPALRSLTVKLRLMVASGKTPTTSPSLSARTADSKAAAPALRSTGMWRIARMNGPANQWPKTADFAMNRTSRCWEMRAEPQEREVEEADVVAADDRAAGRGDVLAAADVEPEAEQPEDDQRQPDHEPVGPVAGVRRGAEEIVRARRRASSRCTWADPNQPRAPPPGRCRAGGSGRVPVVGDTPPGGRRALSTAGDHKRQVALLLGITVVFRHVACVAAAPARDAGASARAGVAALDGAPPGTRCSGAGWPRRRSSWTWAPISWPRPGSVRWRRPASGSRRPSRCTARSPGTAGSRCRVPRRRNPTRQPWTCARSPSSAEHGPRARARRRVVRAGAGAGPRRSACSARCAATRSTPARAGWCVRTDDGEWAVSRRADRLARLGDGARPLSPRSRPAPGCCRRCAGGPGWTRGSAGGCPTRRCR